MTTAADLKWRVLATACAATGLTERAAARFGAAPFLPALFVQRYVNMGGLDRTTFEQQLRSCRSFADERWCAYWNEIAGVHLAAASRLLGDRAEGASAAAAPANPAASAGLDGLGDTLAPYARLLADHGLVPDDAAVAAFVDERRGTDVAASAPAVIGAVQELLRAITYLQVSAFPGGTPHRLEAYHRSRELFDALAAGFAAGLDTTVEPFSVDAAGDVVQGYCCLPTSGGPSPVVVVTNGLEGTVQELLVPLLRYHSSGLGVLVMEMPGSYAYREPMSPASEALYRRVIDTAAADPRVDAGRIAIVGVSFGGYWAARMAAADPRIACAVACGAPTHHSFRPKLGLPEIIIDALAEVTGAGTPVGLLRKLRALSLRDRYGDIAQPLLVINGDRDTLLSTRDSIELAAGAPQAELRLYGGDDHCAMGHYREWLDASQRWLRAQLLTPAGAAEAPHVGPAAEGAARAGDS